MQNKIFHPPLFRFILFLLLLCLLFGASISSAASMAPRIINGEAADIDDTPWMVALVFSESPSSYDGQFCGGSLIHPSWVMTAAHCFLDANDEVDTSLQVDVVIGREDLSASDGLRIPVSSIIANPLYNPSEDDGDIALLQLQTPVEGYAPVKLPGAYIDSALFAAGTEAVGLGWGSTSATDPDYPYNLLKAPLPLVSNATCQDAYGGSITDNMLCAGDGLGMHDTCQGDSGGPLVVRGGATGQEWVQVGITSFGEGCAEPGYYGVYSRVSRYVGAISQAICSSQDIPTQAQLTSNVSGSQVAMSFTGSSGASGYRLYYAPSPSMSPVQYVDLGAATSLEVTLPQGSAYFVAVQPYNGNCLGAFSNLVEIAVP